MPKNITTPTITKPRFVFVKVVLLLPGVFCLSEKNLGSRRTGIDSKPGLRHDGAVTRSVFLGTAVLRRLVFLNSLIGSVLLCL